MRYLFVITLFAVSTSVSFSQTYTIKSPSGKISLVVSNAPRLSYQINFKGKSVINPSTLGFKLNKPDVTLSQFEVIKVDSLSHDETWTPVWGEVNKIRNQYKEIALTLSDKL